MEGLVCVATCNLNQWAMDFDLNLRNICMSIEDARRKGARLRTGPELEISGYGCEDHFWEQDVFFHSWQSIEKLLESDLTVDMLCDVGMPILHHSTRYNCRVFLLNRKIIAIRPKLHLADDGNYREGRWFTAWQRHYQLEEHVLPPRLQALTGQRTVPFGAVILVTNDTTVSCETCEELFTPNSPHIALGLNGAEILLNGSGSHHSVGKLAQRLSLIQSATAKGGGLYLYANQQGCDGGRLYYDGCAMVSMNGKVLAQGDQFSIKDVEVVTAVANLDDIRSFRASVSSRGLQAMAVRQFPSVNVDFTVASLSPTLSPSTYMQPVLLTLPEEIALGPSCWLWDYLRRSGASGFFLPLSGGADSSSTAALVGIMCSLVVTQVEAGHQQVIDDVRRVCGEPADSEWVPADAKELCSRILHTTYMGTVNSSEETNARAKLLADELGAYHLTTKIDTVVDSIVSLFQLVTGKTPRFTTNGGTRPENLALQNIQARMRMVFSYMLAQLLPWVRSRSGFLLVLGSANVDEALRGYMTKYDCSSADINPIGGLSKSDLRQFLKWAGDNYFPSLHEVLKAPPTAELEPITADHKQSDEEDMGMTYEELGVFGRLRKVYRCGPVAMYQKLLHVWKELSPSAVAKRVKTFFRHYSINRHKMTTLTPSYHAESYSPDDNRFDLRQFLYNSAWPRQFSTIDRLVRQQRDNKRAILEFERKLDEDPALPRTPLPVEDLPHVLTLPTTTMTANVVPTNLGSGNDGFYDQGTAITLQINDSQYI